MKAKWIDLYPKQEEWTYERIKADNIKGSSKDLWKR